ncbi:serine/threonine-protein kinase [Streptomyces sp. NPDC047973]|uniref:serine/threonine protein kinase n=1 Tax=Streptomyces sp. NPDC047973 TaxID=3155383 RepID=UPI003420CBD4
MAGAQVDPLGSGDPVALGRYELLGRLASGGMGRIYLARSAEGQLVAVKTLLADGTVSDVDRRRFEREVALAQRIDSAFTARVREADPRAALPWMAIDYIAAPSLTELVRTAGVLPGSAVRWLAAGTAEALVTLHGEGIIHRDIKPQNILLPLAGPRVIDFGISHANDLTRTSLTLGTIAFTSPEQARGEMSTEASDVYSLGATLFHLAVGRPPYRAGSDTFALLAQVQRGELDLGGLPKELTDLIRPCLAADPADRPVPAEMLARFRASLAGLPVTQGGRRWLPQRWTDLISAYERHGRDLARGAGVGTGTAGAAGSEEVTDVLPPPRPTQAYTQEREEAERAERERARQAEAAERERLLREQARQEQARQEAARQEQARKDRERQEEARRERERRQEEERLRQLRKQEKKERKKAQQEAERRERERAERETADRLRAAEARARERAARSASASRSSGTGPPASRNRTPAPAPAPSGKKGGSALAWLVVLAVIVLVLWQANKPDEDGSRSDKGASTSSTAIGSDTDPSTDSDSDSGTDTGSGYTPMPTPDPTPDAEDEAFDEVSSGDCLTAYDDGYGDWSTDTPQTVACGAANAYLRVTSTDSGISGSDCPNGSGESYWTHSGSEPEFSTTLCVERQFRVGQCFVSKHQGDRMVGARLMTVWDCGKETVPKGYDVILQIAGRWKAEATYPPGYCAANRDDREDYWLFEVNDDRTVLCVKWV